MLKVLFYAFVAGVGGTGLGGVICALFRFRSSRTVGFLLSLSGGVLAAVGCFGLFPEAVGLSGIVPVLFSGLLGAFAVMTLSEWVDEMRFRAFEGRSRLLRTGVVLLIGIALQNLPAGIAIGAGDLAGRGIETAICVGLANVPQGIAVCLPLKLSGVANHRLIAAAVGVGFFPVLGACIGCAVGLSAPWLLAAGLAFSGGALLFLSLGVLISESMRLYRGNTSSIAWTGGVLVGLALFGLM